MIEDRGAYIHIHNCQLRPRRESEWGETRNEPGCAYIEVTCSLYFQIPSSTVIQLHTEVLRSIAVAFPGGLEGYEASLISPFCLYLKYGYDYLGIH